MPVQNHIHLADELDAGPELAPIYKWAVRFPEYLDIPAPIIGLQRTLGGKLEVHALRDANGPILFNDYEMSLKVTEEQSLTALQRWDILKAMSGRSVYFVNPDHPDDGSDHTADVKTYVVRVKPIRWLTPNLTLGYVEVELTDNDTVT